MESPMDTHTSISNGGEHPHGMVHGKQGKAKVMYRGWDRFGLLDGWVGLGVTETMRVDPPRVCLQLNPSQIAPDIMTVQGHPHALLLHDQLLLLP